MGRWICLGVMMIGLVLTAGCLPYADHPLTPPGAQEIDARVLGTWYWNESEENGFVHIGQHKKNGLLQILMVEMDADGEIEVMEFSGHTSQIDDLLILNLQWVQPEEAPGYFFVRYLPRVDALGIAIMAENPLEKAISDGTLVGEIIKKKWGDEVHITADAATLRKFVVQNRASLFEEVKFLPRLSLPAMPDQKAK